jgi:3'-phosphoadenosine 5'-phosphosulfate sulfotransferase (PAPS reductase)/FAD synthetase
MIYEHVALSWGAGVQSTALLLLILKEPDRMRKIMGQIPERVYFADPGAESPAIYQHIKQMVQLINTTPDAPEFWQVSIGNILDIEDGRGYFTGAASLPLYTKNMDGKTAMLRRQCTNEYKIKPLQWAIRYACGFKKGSRHPHAVGIWLGISTDEASRMSDSRVQWADNLYPLIELGWNRIDCYNYCVSYGIYPSKSRCYFCPFISDWASIRREEPELFHQAVEFDRRLRHKSRTKHPAYLHRSCLPLDEAVHIQPSLFDGFDNECSGMCGV